MPGMLYTTYSLDCCTILTTIIYKNLFGSWWFFCTKIIRFTFSILDMSLTKVVLNLFSVGGSSITDNRAGCPAVFLRHFLFQSMGVCSLFLALESIKLQPLCNIIHQHMKMNNMHISSSMYLKSNPPCFYDLISNIFNFESKSSVITAEFECLM